MLIPISVKKPDVSSSGAKKAVSRKELQADNGSARKNGQPH